MALRDKLAGAQKECPCLLVYQTMLLLQLWDLCRMLKNIFFWPKKEWECIIENTVQKKNEVRADHGNVKGTDPP